VRITTAHTVTTVLALAVSACGFSKDEGEKLKNQTYALMTQVNAMQQAITDLQATSKKEQELLAKMSTDVDSLNKVSRRNDADIGTQVDALHQEVGRLKGLVESFQERLTTVEAATQKAQEEQDTRFKQLQEQERINQIKSDQEKKKAVEDAAKRERLLADPSALFEEVQKEISGGSAASARDLLRAFSVRAKNDKQLEKRLAEADFLIGETYFAQGEFQKAAAEYNGVRKNHPKSPKVPDALYRLGMCFEKLSLKDDAKLFYNSVLQKYPKSSVAKDAKSRLDALK
jgi:tol-pal system protein YbgF